MVYVIIFFLNDIPKGPNLQITEESLKCVNIQFYFLTASAQSTQNAARNIFSQVEIFQHSAFFQFKS